MNPPLCLTAYIDGGSRGNPGPAGAAYVVRTEDGTVIRETGHFLGRTTNNVAEYRALLAAMEAALELGAKELAVVSDSELLVRQMNGMYRVRNEGLKPLYEKAIGLTEKFSQCSFRHVRREQNRHADRLVNQAINLRHDVDGGAED